jgi:hypothetical protein
MLTEQAIKSVLNKDWKQFKEKHSANEETSKRFHYNIVSVSSYTGHLENYHSDVWGFLLDCNGIHNQGDLFLNLFLKYLITNKHISETAESLFGNAKVLREKGRIDVCIIDSNEKHCIIIENKINNAVDQNKQLERYYDYAKSRKLNVVAILYVSLKGDRQSLIPDGPIVSPLAACNHSENDLLNGWVKKCKQVFNQDNTDSQEDIRSFLHQYSLLLQYLTLSNLKTMSAEILYQFLNTPEDLTTALIIEKELENIKFYREKIFREKMGNNYYLPFTSQGIYAKEYPNYMIFKNWKFQNKYIFQLDIAHYKNRTEFIFYETNGKVSGEETNSFLFAVTGSDQFKFRDRINGNHHFSYSMNVADGYKTLREFDEKVADYSKELFKKMDDFDKNN